MEIIGIGIDIIEVKRIKQALDRQPKIAAKLFTPGELSNCQARSYQYEELAGRFAAKEALLKAIGIGWRRGVKFPEIEVSNEKSGKPYITVFGRVKEFTDRLGVKEIFLTITHTRDLAMAQVILTK